MSNIYTIGTKGWSAKVFLQIVYTIGVRTLFDVRLCPTSRCNTFACGKATGYLYRKLPGVHIVRASDLAPDTDLLGAYRKSGDWDKFSGDYMTLIQKRSENLMAFEPFWSGRHDIILLCSEHKPDRCYRSLAARYIAEKAWENLHVDLIVKHIIASSDLVYEEEEEMPGCTSGL